MLQFTCFGTKIETGVDSKDAYDSGSQGQYREERRSERSKRENDADCRIFRNDRQDRRTFQNNRHDKRARTEAYPHVHRKSILKQKKNFSPRLHAHSHAFRHICTLTHYMTVSTHTYLYSSHTSWKEKKNPVHALRLKKKKRKSM